MTSVNPDFSPLFDTHCHFDFDVFADDFPAQLSTARRHGVTRLLLPAIGPDNWQRLLTLSSEHRELFIALGCHPYFLHRYQLSDLDRLASLLTRRSQQCVAVGECGLDFAIDVEVSLQEQFLLAQIALAEQHRLPLVLHCRKAHNRLLQLLKQTRFSYGGVLHGFAGSYQQAMQFVELGFKIGVGGTITYSRAKKTRNAIAQLPLEALVLETDSPDMPLMGYQGEPNHPKRLAQILEALVVLRQEDKQTVASSVWKISNLAFGICE
ncbi:TatD family hydrolase [Vibrio sp. V39_P1S14PM300]|uniref:TatD family hydrolase n=1 Tax=Vibrio sp. V39_P1S14PM300 TaxID=1938690 RepID=UPI001372ABF1|nr:TatD family hydrolase [Vibrio sp. V39_P1S14PM300]NAX21666.1 TatD family deoxyribonuclease [Vibrio sp. V39_P1S14PM300]